MKRYLLFMGDEYYPCGGWDDFIGAFDTLEEAQKEASVDSYSWYQIVDTATMKEVTHG